MKKIIVITFHRANNYGALLQTYALQKVLNNQYDAYVLDYDCHRISDGYKTIQKLDGDLLKRIETVIKNVLFFPLNKKRNNRFDSFRKILKMTDYYDDTEILKRHYPDADIYIAGSDQIWNTDITGGFSDIYTLQFVNKEIRKISYAASCGSIDKMNKYEESFISALNNLDFISVRENNICREYENKINKNISLVLDPTLLLTKDEWQDLIKNEKKSSGKYIFAYSQGKANDIYYSTINQLAKRTKLPVLYFSRNDFKIKGRKICGYQYGPIEFLNLLNDAEYVVTSSFHGTALSLILNKNVFIVPSFFPERLLSLVSMVRFKKRVLLDANHFEEAFNNKINWCDIDNILTIERNKSIQWLHESIKGDNHG